MSNQSHNNWIDANDPSTNWVYHFTVHCFCAHLPLNWNAQLLNTSANFKLIS